MTDITIQYERKMSDGNYGSEGLSVSMTETFEQPPSDDDLDVLVRRLRVFVLVELSKSEARNVAYAAQRELNPPPPRQAVAPGAPADLEDMPF